MAAISATITRMRGATPASGATPTDQAPRVLVVDDEPAVARTTERILSRQGFAVTVVGGGREAIEVAQSSPFDAIVSDLGMPDVDGRALLRAIRGQDLDVPFVFLTGQPDLESAIDAV